MDFAVATTRPVNMEVQSLYDDGFNMGRGALKKLKANMTLDFNSDKPRFGRPNGMLASPDLQMLKLASPDLEKLIIQSSNGMVTTTPTMAGTPTQILCPKSVTEEQEAYARGFVDALAELHKKGVGEDGCVEMSEGESQEAPLQIPQASTYTTLTTVSVSNTAMMTTAAGQPLMASIAASQPQVNNTFSTTVSQLPGSILSTVPSRTSNSPMPSSVGSYQAPSPHLSGLHSMPTSRTQSPALSLSGVPTTVNGEHILHLKEEPQIVPDVSPINMENQERIKLERKRARNRLAARKCRTRKLERISRLEDRVDELKGHNSDLSRTATVLRDQVCKLKEQIMVHVNSGCKVMLSPNLL